MNRYPTLSLVAVLIVASSMVSAGDESPQDLFDRGEMLTARARALAVEASRTGRGEQANEKRTEAREIYHQATMVYTAAHEAIAKKLASFPPAIAPGNRAAIAQRDQLRADYLKAQLIVAVLKYEAASTHRNNEDRNDALIEAAEAFGVIYEKYRRRLAGLYASQQQSKCYEEAEQTEQALKGYEELLEQPTEPAVFRPLRTKALAGAVRCWIQQGKADLAIERSQAWLDELVPDERSHRDGLALQFALAQAYHRASGDEASEERQETLRAKAVELSQRVASSDSKHRLDARRLLNRLGVGEPVPMDGNADTFEEAFQHGKDDLSSLNDVNLELGEVRQQLAEAALPSDRVKLQNRESDLTDRMRKLRTSAIVRFNQCLALEHADVSQADRGNVRFFLSYLHYTQGDYEAAIASALPLLEDDLDHNNALRTAQIVFASRLHLYGTAIAQDRKAKIAKEAIEISELIQRTWPDDDIAKQVKRTVEGFKIRTRRDQAEFEDVPVEVTD